MHYSMRDIKISIYLSIIGREYRDIMYEQLTVTSRGRNRKMAPRIPVAQKMTVRHPAMIISVAPEAMKSLSTAMPQLPMPMTTQPRI